jgi:hypothetical protein
MKEMERALTIALLQLLAFLALSGAAASAAEAVNAGIGALQPVGGASTERGVSISVPPEAYHMLVEQTGTASHEDATATAGKHK